MKRLITAAFTFVFACLLLLPVASAETAGFTGNLIRFDVTREEYMALGADLYGAGGDRFYAGARQMLDFPLVPECMAELLDEFLNNRSRLEKDEYTVSWYTEAMKAVYDERLIGARVSVEFSGGGKKLELNSSYDVNWREGVACFGLPEGYSFEEISGLRISYGTGDWLYEGSSNAVFELNYEVSDGKVTCREIEVIMECGYCHAWYLHRTEEGQVIFSLTSEDLSVDASVNAMFDAVTGKYLLED